MQVRSAGYDSPMVFNCQMGAGRTTTGTVIGGLLAMYGYGNPSAVLPAAAGGASGGGSFVAGAAGASGGPLVPIPAPVATGAKRQGSGPAAAAGGAAEGLVAELNEDQSRDILREEIGGDSPRCSGVPGLVWTSVHRHVLLNVAGNTAGCLSVIISRWFGVHCRLFVLFCPLSSSTTAWVVRAQGRWLDTRLCSKHWLPWRWLLRADLLRLPPLLFLFCSQTMREMTCCRQQHCPP
jgi:hypothetical protein